jgi:hypothetical protein
MARLAGQETDPVSRRGRGRDPRDVDPAWPPVRGSVAFGKDDDVGPGFGRRNGGRQPSQARPDDDDVSAGH